MRTAAAARPEENGARNAEALVPGARAQRPAHPGERPARAKLAERFAGLVRRLRPGSGWLALAALAAAAPAVAQPIVAVTGGSVSGSEAPGGGALLFRGIPYAAPPVGDRRWRPPAAVIAWKGVRADRADAPGCPQPDQHWNHDAVASASEDCLTLDVRTPALAGKRPVMLWIHGGSNIAGSARGTVLSRISDRGVVLVAIQYRLGALGFLAHRGAAAEAGGHAGNYALMDQIAALKWVRANIARFGGDPANVTIFGQSAGSEDVGLMLAAPGARGLFARAILESGTPGFGLPPRPLVDALSLGDQFDTLLNADGSIAELRKRPVAEILAADAKLTDPALGGSDFRWLRTTIDGAVLPASLRELIAAAPKRPVIIGTNRAEFAPAPGGVDWDRDLARSFGANAKRARAYYSGPIQRLGSPEMQYWTDWLFRCPAGKLADLLSVNASPVWRYEFDLARDGGITAHSAEIPFVMDDIDFAEGVSLQAYWVNFARTGDPNGGKLPDWPRYWLQSQRLVRFDAKGVTVDAHLRQPVCSMLEEL